jgi:hypothetical protein
MSEEKNTMPTLDDFREMVRDIIESNKDSIKWPKQMLPENYIKCDFKPEDQIKEGYTYTADNGMAFLTGYGGALLMVKASREAGHSDNDICNQIFINNGNQCVPLAAIIWKEKK